MNTCSRTARLSVIILLLSVSVCANAVSAANDDPSRDSLRQELAEVMVKLLERRRDGLPDEDRKLDKRIGELFGEIGTISSEEEAIALIIDVLTEHAPGTLGLFHRIEEEKFAAQTQGRFQLLKAALEMFNLEARRYPTASEGLLALMVGTDIDDPLISMYDARDGWNHVILYEVTSDNSYTLRSIGPDGKADTSDDLVAHVPDEAEASKAELDSVAEISVVGTLAEDESLESVQIAPDGNGVACEIRRGAQWSVRFGASEHEPFDSVSPPRFSPAGNVVMYTAQTGEEHFAVINGTKHTIDNPVFTGCRFVEGSDIWSTAVHGGTDGVTWIVGSGDWIAFNKNRWDDHVTSEPVFDANFRCLAVRVRHGDAWFVHDKSSVTDACDWVSVPTVVPGGGAVTYRTWASGRTRVVVDGAVIGEHDWARTPVFNEDGTHLAYAMCEGGEPGPKFTGVREVVPGDNSAWRFLNTPAYTGGTYHIVFDGDAGPGFTFVKDPILDASGTSIAYAAQRADGRWVAVFGDTVSDSYEGVYSITFDRTAKRIAWIAKNDGQYFAVTGDKEFPPCSDMGNLAISDSGAIAYSESRDNGEKVLFVNGTMNGPFDRIHSVGFLAGSTTAFAKVKKGKQYGVIFDGTVKHWFEQITPIILSPDHSNFAYSAKDDHGWHVVLNDTVGPAFGSVSRPFFLADGRAVYIGETTHAQDRQASQHVVVDGVVGDACTLAYDLDVSPDRWRLCYAATSEDGSSMIVDIDGRTVHSDGGTMRFIQFDNDNSWIAYESTPDYERLLIDGITQPAFDVVRIPRMDSPTAPFIYEGTEKGRSAYIVGDWISPSFEFVHNPIFDAAGTTLACNARNGDSWFLVVDDWTSPPFDEIFSPEFSADGKSVRCGARRGRDILTVHVELAKIREESSRHVSHP